MTGKENTLEQYRINPRLKNTAHTAALRLLGYQQDPDTALGGILVYRVEKTFLASWYKATKEVMKKLAFPDGYSFSVRDMTINDASGSPVYTEDSGELLIVLDTARDLVMSADWTCGNSSPHPDDLSSRLAGADLSGIPHFDF